MNKKVECNNAKIYRGTLLSIHGPEENILTLVADVTMLVLLEGIAPLSSILFRNFLLKANEPEEREDVLCFCVF